MPKLNAITLILSDARGQYIPRDFVCDDYNEIAVDHCEAWHISLKDAETLRDPDCEWYWDTWASVCDSAYYMEGEHKFTLWQDGDLWGICPELMTNEEHVNFFGEMKPAPNDAYEFEVCENCLMVLANDDATGMSDAEEKATRNSLFKLLCEYDQLIPDGAEYGFRNNTCECCDSLPGDRFRVLAFKKDTE